jgi:transposase
VPTGDDHTKVHVCGAVAPLTGRTHDHVSPTLGQEECAPFLRHLLGYDPRKRLLVIHDRGQQHRGTCLEEVVRGAAGRLVLKPQPAYAPALNPQERIWKWLRRVVTHKPWFATLREQIEAARNCWSARRMAAVVWALPWCRCPLGPPVMVNPQPIHPHTLGLNT